jgi:Cys-rich protein (TIGR01571 family)
MADGFGNCLKSTWLPFVKHADNAEQAARKTNPSAPSCFSKQLIMWVVSSVVYACGAAQLPVRRQVREMYGISEEESCCNSDLMTSCFCHLCDRVQVGVQLKKPLPDLRR